MEISRTVSQKNNTGTTWVPAPLTTGTGNRVPEIPRTSLLLNGLWADVKRRDNNRAAELERSYGPAIDQPTLPHASFRNSLLYSPCSEQY